MKRIFKSFCLSFIISYLLLGIFFDDLRISLALIISILTLVLSLKEEYNIKTIGKTFYYDLNTKFALEEIPEYK